MTDEEWDDFFSVTGCRRPRKVLRLTIEDSVTGASSQGELVADARDLPGKPEGSDGSGRARRYLLKELAEGPAGGNGEEG